MAYGNGNAQSQARPAYGQRDSGSQVRPGGARPEMADGGKREFVEDPSKVGIGYVKSTKGGEDYITFTATKDIKEGTKFVAWLNSKVKTRTEKTPTHILKLAKTKEQLAAVGK